MGSEVLSFGASLVIKKENIPGSITLHIHNHDLGSPQSTFTWEARNANSAIGAKLHGSLKHFSSKPKKGKKKGETVMQLSNSNGKSYLFNFGVQHTNAEKLYGILKDAAASPAPTTIEQPKSRNKAALEIRKATSSFQQQQQQHSGGSNSSAPVRLSAQSGVDPKTIEGRQSLLASDLQLKETYDNLVKGGVVTEEDFWHSRSRELREEQKKLKQLRGLSSGLTSNITTHSESQETLKVVLNKEKINRIFLEFPQVEKIYQDNVPHVMSESEFWTMYFHSKYRHKQGGKSAKGKEKSKVAGEDSEEAKAESKAEKLFGSAHEDKEREIEKRQTETGNAKQKTSQVDPAVDLVTTVYDNPIGQYTELAGVGLEDKVGFGLIRRDPQEADKDEEIRQTLKRKRAHGEQISQATIKHMVNDPLQSGPLMSSYNTHGTLVLNSGQHTSEKNRVERAEAMEEDAAVFDDLQGSKKKNTIELNIQDKSKYFQTNAVQTTTWGDAIDLSELPMDGRSLENWKPQLKSLFSSTANHSVIDELSTKPTEDQADSFSLQSFLESDRKALLKNFDATDELLRHFWAGFPAKQAASIAKLDAIVARLRDTVSSIESLRSELLQGPRAVKNATTLVPLLEPITDKISRATTVYTKQKKKRARRH